MTAFECISCSFFICIYKLFFIFFPPRRLVSHFGSSFKTPQLHQFNKEVHTAKLGCYLKRLFFLNSFQQFYLSSIKIRKCLDLCISLTSDLATCISVSPSLVPFYLCCCQSFRPIPSSFLGICGLPAYCVHKKLYSLSLVSVLFMINCQFNKDPI